MASTRIKRNHPDAKPLDQRMGARVDHLTNLSLPSMTSDSNANSKPLASRLRGTYQASGIDERASLLASLKAKHLR